MMSFIHKPLVKGILSFIAGLMTASSQVPVLAPYAVGLTSLGAFILGALHVPTPSGVSPVVAAVVAASHQA